MSNRVIYWPRWWTWRTRARQVLAVIVGYPRGRGLPETQRCHACGAPARDWRYYCTNRTCVNWIPF